MMGAAALLLGMVLSAIPVSEATSLRLPQLEALSLEENLPEAEPSADQEANDDSSPPYLPLRSPSLCPPDIETLTALLIHDLPDYTNRVIQRTVAALPNNEVDGRAPYRPAYILIAGRLELEPLDLNEYTFTTSPEAGGPLSQVFFTTLSRQYFGLRVDEVQQYHWLFLTQASDGWRLALMFSAIDDVQTARSLLPPRESSESSVGQAVQLWLRDCRAGAIYPLEG